MVKKVGAHKNIIREIIEVPDVGILTCSNDSSIKMWGMGTLEEFANFSHHDSFVFSLASLGSTNFASGGEDFRLKTLIEGKIVDEVMHPNTIWSIGVDESNEQDLITACGDG